jgi:hypothetical protein
VERLDRRPAGAMRLDHPLVAAGAEQLRAVLAEVLAEAPEPEVLEP